MDLPGNRPRVARKKFWGRFLKCTTQYESHLVTISAKCFPKSPAKCPAFSCHFLPSMLCVPAPCEVYATYTKKKNLLKKELLTGKKASYAYFHNQATLSS